MDRLCLSFCISFLDHDLRGNLFESVIVGLFADLNRIEADLGFRLMVARQCRHE
jgi:hypothetical protein